MRTAIAAAAGPAATLLAVLVPAIAAASGSGWTEILLLQDGLYNNAARLAYDPRNGHLNLAYKSQLDVDSNTRQIAAGIYDFDAWALGNVTSNVSSKEYPDIVVSGDGTAHVVWREHLGGGDWQIFYAQGVGGLWSVPKQITFEATQKGAPRIARKPAPIAADTSGVVHVVYATPLESGTANDEVYYLRYDASSGTGQTVAVTADGVSDDDPQIAVNETGDVFLAWISGGFEGAIRCAVGGLGGFTELPTGVGSGAAKPDLFLGQDGLHIAYRASLGGSTKVIRHIHEIRAGFSVPVNVSPSDALYTEPSIVVGGNVPSVAYVTNTSGLKGLYVAQGNGSGFDPPETIHSDAGVTYNETDFLVEPFTVGLPLRALSNAYVVTSTGYVAGKVVADLHVFQGLVAATAAPVVATPVLGLELRSFPNPFTTGTTISFTLARAASRVSIEVFDVAGRRLAQQHLGSRGIGTHAVGIPGRELPGGVYWIRLTADGAERARKIQHLR